MMNATGQTVPTEDELRVTEQKLENLAKEAEQIEKDVKDFVTTNTQPESQSVDDSEGVKQKAREIGEQITQALLRCDNIPVSKSAAAMALKVGNRQMARKMAVLITRRKNIIRKLEESAAKMEKLPKKGKS